MAQTVRIRGRKLMRINRRMREEQPLCVWCAAGKCRHDERKQAGRDPVCITVATQTDHVVPLLAGGPETYQNRQRLCDDCHKVKTAADKGQAAPARRRQISVSGWAIE